MMKRFAVYLVFVVVVVTIGAGCSHLVKETTTETTDPKTGVTTEVTKKELTEEGQKVVAAGKTVVTVATAPLGLPPELWDWVAKVAVGIFLGEGSRRTYRKLKESEPGKILG
jgi:hypothetical protein